MADATATPPAIPDVGLPYLPPASPALEEILTSGSLASRGVLFVCQDIARADVLTAALARAWLCESNPLGCGKCMTCRGGDPNAPSPVRVSSERINAPQLAKAMAPFGAHDVWCVIAHDAPCMTAEAAGFLVSSLVEGHVEPGGLVMLTAPSLESVPEPVKSRCVRFDMRDGTPIPPSAEEWTTERTRAEELEALGFCLSGDVFGPYRAAIEKLSLEPVRKLVRSWEEALENGTGDDGREHWIAGIILRADRACERACGFMKLRTVDDYEIEVAPAETMSREQRSLLHVGACVALHVSFAPGLKRWWGTPTVGVVRNAAPVPTSQTAPTPH